MTRLDLLGGVGLEGPHGPIRGVVAQRKRLALLALLALAPEQRLGRDKILAYLWPEAEPDRARHQLSSTLYEVRKLVGDDSILATGNELRLNPAVVRSDVAAFEAALEQGDAARAVALYKGPFLDGFYLRGTVEFERWAERERDRLASGFARALESVAERAEANGDLPAAIESWKARAAHDPYDSRVALRLMEALERGGNPAGALQHGMAHELLLHGELGVAPDPRVHALLNRLRAVAATEVHAVAPPASSTPRTAARLQRDAESPARPAAGEAAAGVRKRAGRRVTPWAAVGFLLFMMGMAAAWLNREPQGSGAPGAYVVLTPFANHTADPGLDPVGRMASDWIAHSLWRIPDAKVILDAGEPADLPSGRSVIITGAYYQQGDSLRFHAQITEARSSRLLRALGGIASPVTNPEQAVETLAEQVAAALAVVLDTRLAAVGNLTSQPSSYEAFHANLEGMDRGSTADWLAAIDHYERALALDTSYLLPRLQIGFARLYLGQPDAADSIARRLNASRARMMPFERALLDLLQAHLAEDQATAYEAAKRAAGIGPGSIAHVRWGTEALRLGRPRGAIQALSEIDPAGAALRGWRPYWFTLAGARHTLGEHRVELREARRARALHADEAWPLLLEARALAALGHVAGIEALIDARRSLPDPLYPHLGLMKHLIGQELQAHSAPGYANDLYDRAIAWYRGRPADERDGPAYRSQLALVFLAADRLAEAEALFRGLAAESPDHPYLQGVLGVIAARRGDRAEAERIEAMLAEVQVPYRAGDQLRWRACIQAHLGKRDEALSLLQQAAARAAHVGHTSFCVDPLRDHPAFRDWASPRG